MRLESREDIKRRIEEYFDREGYRKRDIEEVYEFLEEKKIEDIDDYDSIAEIYHIIIAPKREFEVERVCDIYSLILATKPKVVVDGGCGTGLDICFFATQLPDTLFIGYDKSENMLAVVEVHKKRAGANNLEFIHLAHENIAQLPEKPELLYTKDSLDLWSAQEFIENFYEVLADDGMYINTGPGFYRDVVYEPSMFEYMNNLTLSAGFKTFEFFDGLHYKVYEDGELNYPWIAVYKKEQGK